MRRFPLLSLLILFAVPGCAGRGKNGSIQASGYIEATEVRVGTKVAGRLMSLKTREGDTVKKDQVLAQIDPVDLKLALDTAQADRQQAEADFSGAEKDFKRMEELFSAGSGTQKARDDAKTRRDGTAARLASAKARIAQLEQQMRDTVIASPVDGVVTQKLVEEGELLPAGSTLLVVTDLADAWLTAYVSDADLSRIRLGQEADVVTDAGASRKGRITFISSTAEFTPKNVQTRDERVKLVYKIKVAAENADGLFKSGMPAQATLKAVAVTK